MEEDWRQEGWKECWKAWREEGWKDDVSSGDICLSSDLVDSWSMDGSPSPSPSIPAFSSRAGRLVDAVVACGGECLLL
jgi:hypothetical protein